MSSIEPLGDLHPAPRNFVRIFEILYPNCVHAERAHRGERANHFICNVLVRLPLHMKRSYLMVILLEKLHLVTPDLTGGRHRAEDDPRREDRRPCSPPGWPAGHWQGAFCFYCYNVWSCVVGAGLENRAALNGGSIRIRHTLACPTPFLE